MRLRVLLVDENDEDRSSLAERLRRADGLELVGAVGAGENALALKEDGPDVVLVNLHRRDGAELELCRSLAASGLTPLVALVSYVTPEGATALRNAGVSSWLLKHVDSRMLDDGLHRALEQHRSV